MFRWLSILCVAVGALGLSACSSSDDPFGTGGTGGGVGGTRRSCDEAPVPSCGDACDSDSECALGAYCDGTCTFQCTESLDCAPDCNIECNPGFRCNSRGRCVQIFGTGGTGGTGNSGGNDCQSVEVTPSPSIPNVMFLLDRSGSMDNGFGGGQSRWQAARSAIIAVSTELSSRVRFGLTTYHSVDGGSVPDQCPITETQIAIDFDTFDDFASALATTFPGANGDDTPTGEAIMVLVGYLDAAELPSDGPTIIVLATDGEPDTCQFPDSNQNFARNRSVTEATNAFLAGYQTFILSVGDQVGADHLQDMANVGVGLDQDDGDATFWVANNPQSLEDAFDEIIGGSISCDIEIDRPFDDTDLACQQGDVRLNGEALDCPDDWRVKPGVDNVIELVGSACQQFKAEASTFTAEFPCGAVVVVQ